MQHLIFLRDLSKTELTDEKMFKICNYALDSQSDLLSHQQ